MKLAIFIGGGFVLLLLGIILAPFTIISAGERGIVFHVGRIDRVLTEGIHWRTPLVESVEKVDISTRKDEVEASAASKDLQSVSAKIAVNYRLDADKVSNIWTEFKGDENARLIAPAVQESVKAATAKYTAEELITKRDAVKTEILNTLKERLSPNNILVSNVSIIDFDFSPSFNQAIERKVTAEQEALAAKNKLEQIKFEAQQKVATAKAEAESIRLQSDAANNEKYVSLKALEVQHEFARKWNGQLPVNLYGSAPIPFLNLTK